MLFLFIKIYILYNLNDLKELIFKYDGSKFYLGVRDGYITSKYKRCVNCNKFYRPNLPDGSKFLKNIGEDIHKTTNGYLCENCKDNKKKDKIERFNYLNSTRLEFIFKSIKI